MAHRFLAVKNTVAWLVTSILYFAFQSALEFAVGLSAEVSYLSLVHSLPFEINFIGQLADLKEFDFHYIVEVVVESIH